MPVRSRHCKWGITLHDATGKLGRRKVGIDPKPGDLPILGAPVVPTRDREEVR